VVDEELDGAELLRGPAHHPSELSCWSAAPANQARIERIRPVGGAWRVQPQRHENSSTDVGARLNERLISERLDAHLAARFAQRSL
jgi:hypothetical protein